MAKWARGYFFETKTFEKVQPGEAVYFEDIGQIPGFDRSVIPFLLDVKHPRFLMPKSCIQIDPGSSIVYQDLKRIIEPTTLRIESSEGLVLEEAPLFTYVCARASAIERPTRIIETMIFPFEMELEPKFRDFKIVLEFSDGFRPVYVIKLGLILDAYTRLRDDKQQIEKGVQGASYVR